MRAFLIVLDSVGIGAAPDADDYGDAGSNTLGNLAKTVPLHLPCLQRLGLGNIPPLIDPTTRLTGIPPAANPIAAYGAMREVSQGKDTTTGHWEIAGLRLDQGFRLFPKSNSFPPEILGALREATHREILGNKAASGTAIIAELGAQHMATGAWIVYTSADSVLQIAAHEAVIPPEELYAACRQVRAVCNPFNVGRVIARPFTGRPGAFQRTDRRRDFAMTPPQPTILDQLSNKGFDVITVGKLDDIFAHRGMTESFHSETSAEAITSLTALQPRPFNGLVFANLIDFDMRYGHRRDPQGYAGALESTDSFLSHFLPALAPEDLVILTADHGNDPTFKGADHTREYVPLLVVGSGCRGSLGIRHGFFDIAQSLAQRFGLPALPHGLSFLEKP